MTDRELHAETVSTFDLGECSIQRGEWPYDCDAKTQHPNHAVYYCATHDVWWHEPAPVACPSGHGLGMSQAGSPVTVPYGAKQD